MHEIVRHTQVEADEVRCDEPGNPGYKEHDAKKFADGFCHIMFCLSFLRKVFTTVSGRIGFLKGRFRVFQVLASEG